MTQKKFVSTIFQTKFQSQPRLIIHHTINERLEGSSWYEMAESFCNHSSLVWNVGTRNRKFHHPVTQKSGCGDGCGGWIPISTLFIHLTYWWWEIGRVELMWMAWIFPETLNLGAKSGYGPSQICNHSWLRKSLYRPFFRPNSNLNLVWSFIILLMRDWKGQADMKWLNQSVHTQAWCET